MSIAVSEDGVHYQEVGPIIHKREDAVWLGTGSTWKTEQGFVLNFSESRNDVQNIFFAQSNDLLHWQILEDEFRSAPDARWYDDTPKGRWDCIWTIARPGGGFYGYLTARPWNKIRGMNYESIGMLESDDGLHWSACPPPTIEWGDWPITNVGEVGAIEKINDTYYLMLGYSEQGLGERQISGYEIQTPSGMYLFTAKSPLGPFRPATHAYRLLVSNGTYFTRFYRTPQELLINHHSIEKVSETAKIWMAPLKSCVIDAAGDLHPGYWLGNESCKGKLLQINFLESSRVYPVDQVEDHLMEERRLQVDEPVSGAIYRMKNELDTNAGAVIEGYVTICPTVGRWGGLGIFLEPEGKPDTAYGVMMLTSGITELMHFKHMRYNNCQTMERVNKGIAAEKRHHLRILFRKTMLEIYRDDLLIQCYSMPEKLSGNWGFICESGRAVFEDFKVWNMNL
jgi:hypothetical protein